MDRDEYRSHDALGLASLVRSKQVSPSELLDCALTEVEHSNPALNAVVSIFEAKAHASIAAGLPEGPLTGVPFVIKDLWTAVEGVETSNGSLLYAGDVAPGDAEMIRRYRAGGLVLFAKTNTPEFGLSPTTEPARWGATRNPWNRERSAGGSSGGSAAAVAAGMVPAAHASDGGGSIRIPASCCGLFGLKPSRGRVSFAPDRSEGWGGLSTQHAVTRSVRDSAALLDCVAGPVPGDPYAAPDQGRPYLQELSEQPGRLRVGLTTVSPGGVPVDPVCAAAAESTAGRLAALGHDVRTVDWPFAAELFAAAQTAIIGPHIATAVDDRLASSGGSASLGDLEPVTAAIAGWGRTASAQDYIRALNAAHAVGRSMGGLFEDIDVLVTPTLARTTPPLGVLDGQDVERFVREVPPMVAFTSVCNLSGQPAMSLPLDTTPDGVPVGTQIIGRFGAEAVLFRLAGQLELAHPWPGTAPA